MKRLFFLFFAVAFMPMQEVHAQPITVVDAAVATLIEATHLEQVIYYGQMIGQQVESVFNLVNQVRLLEEQVRFAIKNIQSAKDIRSFDDFMGWYNRQIYMEKAAADTYNNLSIRIGSKDYKFTTLEGARGMASGFNETYVDYWKEEFTPEQRREMWLGLGLTPANYAYVEPFRSAARETRKIMFAAPDVQNMSYIFDMQRNHEIQQKLAMDNFLGIDDKMGDKEILMMQLETELRNNKALNDLLMYAAAEAKMTAAQMYLDDAPSDAPAISETTWEDGGGFRKLK